MVMRLHKAGTSLRGIAVHTGLGIRTIRTITESSTGADRTTLKAEAFRQRALHKARMATYRARKRVRDALPKRISDLLQSGPELLKRLAEGDSARPRSGQSCSTRVMTHYEPLRHRHFLAVALKKPHKTRLS
jgi:hypothetical protein